jgi:hypothetical protein
MFHAVQTALLKHLSPHAFGIGTDFMHLPLLTIHANREIYVAMAVRNKDALFTHASFESFGNIRTGFLCKS